MNATHRPDIGYLGIRNLDDLVECFEVDYGDTEVIDNEQAEAAQVRPAVGEAPADTDRQHNVMDLDRD